MGLRQFGFGSGGLGSGLGGPVALQAASPGTAQTGNVNVTGTLIAHTVSVTSGTGTADGYLFDLDGTAGIRWNSGATYIGAATRAQYGFDGSGIHIKDAGATNVVHLSIPNPNTLSLVGNAASGIFAVDSVSLNSINSLNGGTQTIGIGGRDFATAGNMVAVPGSTFTNTAGTSAAILVNPTYNQAASTAVNYDLQVNRTETSLGSGAQRLASLGAGGVSYIERFGVDNAGQTVESTANGATWTHGQASELLTLSTGGTTTDTSANLLPANSIIEAVVARVTTTITVATNWKLGDPTTAGRFTAANSNLTAGTTDVGLVHVDQAAAAGPRQTAAAKVRVTTTGTPGAGVVRITVFYRQFVPPTT